MEDAGIMSSTGDIPAAMLWVRKLDERLPLQENETALKEIYLHGGSSYFDEPMQTDEYNRLCRSDRHFPYAGAWGADGFEFDASGDPAGGEPDEEKIDLIIHTRYSLPVMHSHRFTELFYAYSGGGLLFVGSKTLDLSPGDLCFVAPNTEHALSSTEDDSLIVRIRLGQYYTESSFLRKFEGRYVLRDFFRRILYGQSPSPYLLFRTAREDGQPDIWFQAKIASIYWEANGKLTAYREFMELELRELLINIVRWFELTAVVSDPVSDRQNDIIAALLSYLSVNFAHATLKETAEFFSYNEAYISRMIKRYTGKSFKALLTEIQMTRAKELIEEGRMTMAQISREVGCCDESHFNHKFKEQFGMSPKQFRSMGRNSPNIT